MNGAVPPSAKPLTPSTSRLGADPRAQTHIPVHEEIKSVSLHGAEFQSGIAVALAIKYDRLYSLLLKWFFLPCPVPLFKSKRGHIFPFITEVRWMRNQGLFASSPPLLREAAAAGNGCKRIPSWQATRSRWKLLFWRTVTSNRPDSL